MDKALTGVITILEQETRAQGESPEEAAWLDKFRSWREELGEVRSGEGAKILARQGGGKGFERSGGDLRRGVQGGRREALGEVREGGLFTD